MRANCVGTRKEFLNNFWPGIGGNIEAAVCDRRIFNNADTTGEAPALQFPGLRRSSLTLPKRIDNKQDDRD